jgi:hypothetical protein
MFVVALTILILIILLYGAFAAALIFHVHAYVIKEDPSHNYIMPFLIISSILIILSIIFFLQVPWNDFTLFYP